MKEKIKDFTLMFLFISFIFDPTGDFFNFKYISVLACFFVFGINFLINYRAIHFTKTQLLFLSTFCLFIPIYGLNLTLFNTDLSNFSDTSYIGFALTTFLLIPTLIHTSNSFIKVFINSLRILMACIFLILISFLIDGDSLGFAQFFIDHKSMLMGFREYSGITTYYIYFTASPLLIILVAYDSYSFLNKSSFIKFILLTLSIIAIFLTGTRFNMLVSILILPLAMILKKYSIKRVFFNFLILLTFLIIVKNNKFTSSFFKSSDDSNNTKIGYLQSYIPIFSNPKFFILGQGFNAHYWSTDFKLLMTKSDNDGTKTELTYLEFLRVFGVFFGIILNLFVFSMPIILYLVYKEFNFLVLGVLIYILSSAINPYIFSTNGVLVFLLFLISINKSSKFESLKLIEP